MGDARVVQPPNLPPQLLEDLVAHLIGAGELEWRDIRLARGQDGVVVGAEADRDHFRYPDTGLAGHQRRERLVFDLLQPSDGGALREVSVGEQAPATGEPLGVLRVPAKYAYLQRVAVAVVPDELGRPDTLPLGDRQVACVDPERREGSANAPRGRHARCRAERQAHERRRSESEGQATQCTGRQNCFERDGADGHHGNEPRRDHSNRSDELRAGDSQDGRHERKAHLREPPPRPQVGVDREPVGLDNAAENAREPGNDEHCERQIAKQIPATSIESVRDDRQREGERAHKGGTPDSRRPTQHSHQRLLDAFVFGGSRLGDHGAEGDDRRRSCDEHGVDRAPVPATRLGRREQREIPRTSGRRGLVVSVRRRCRQDYTCPAGAATPTTRTRCTSGASAQPRHLRTPAGVTIE